MHLTGRLTRYAAIRRSISALFIVLALLLSNGCVHEINNLLGSLGIPIDSDTGGTETVSKPASKKTTGKSTPTQTSSDISGKALAASVQKYLGVKYVWGGMTPQGFDCSGLMVYVAKQHKITIPRTSAEQATAGRAVAKKNLKPGDLVFFGRTSSGPVDHVGMYIGNDTYVHAPNPENPVMKTKLSDNSFVKNGTRYIFKGKYVTARRITG